MANIHLVCGNCSAEFEVMDELAGLLATCPQCRGQVAVPLSAEHTSHAPKLQIKMGSPVATAYRNCPACGGLIQEDAVFCVQCGYNFKTGKRYGEVGARAKMIRNLLAGTGLVILCIAVLVLVRSLRGSSDTGMTPEITDAPMAVVATTSVPTAVAAVAPGETASTATDLEGAEALSNVLEQTDIESALAQMEQDFKNTVKAQLDKKYPAYAKGEMVALRKSNGMVHRGTLEVVTRELAVIIQNGRHTEISLSELDRETRLRCDPAFREKWINAQVKKRFKDLNNS